MPAGSSGSETKLHAFSEKREEARAENVHVQDRDKSLRRLRVCAFARRPASSGVVVGEATPRASSGSGSGVLHREPLFRKSINLEYLDI